MAPDTRTYNTLLFTLVLSLGLTSLVTQLVMMREFMAVFTSNEIVIGILLANWMILTGVGAWLGRTVKWIRNFGLTTVILFSIFSVLPYVTLFLVDFLRTVIAQAGVMVNLSAIMLWSFILLMPYCLLAGFLFSLFSVMVSDQKGGNSIANVYSTEAWGSVAGGTLFSLALVHLLDHYAILTLVLFLNLVLAGIFAVLQNRKVLAVIPLSALVVSALVVAVVRPDRTAISRLFPGQEIAERKETPYGNITLTRTGGQMNMYINSTPLFYSSGLASDEEQVHYGMLQHPSPRQVLIISGDLKSLLCEAYKYPLERMDYLEINPWIIQLWMKDHLPSPDSVRIIYKDARRYVGHATEKYDVVLLNIPGAVTAQQNRYFTSEFFRELKAILNPGGVVSTCLVAAGNYMGEESATIHAIHYNTLKEHFRNVIIVPGYMDYYIASDSALSLSVVELAEKRGIENRYVNRYYLNDSLLAQRSAVITERIMGHQRLNHDFRPAAYFIQMKLWLSHFRRYEALIPFIFLLPMVIILFRINAVQAGLLTIGFAASSMEIIILIAFQVVSGYLYLANGMLISLFMTGMAAGAWLGNRWYRDHLFRHFTCLQALASVIILLLPLIFVILQKTGNPDALAYPFFAAMMLALSVLTGLVFNLSSRIRVTDIARSSGELYGIDLLGASLGSVLTAAYLIPLLGLIMVSVFVAAVCLLSAIVAFIRRKQFGTV